MDFLALVGAGAARETVAVLDTGKLAGSGGGAGALTVGLDRGKSALRAAYGAQPSMPEQMGSIIDVLGRDLRDRTGQAVSETM